jgi:hypothetical protein
MSRELPPFFGRNVTGQRFCLGIGFHGQQRCLGVQEREAVKRNFFRTRPNRLHSHLLKEPHNSNRDPLRAT